VDNEFGDTLRALRNQAGLSLAAIARRIPWSKAAIGHAETGARPPSPELACALDRELGARGLLIALAGADRAARRIVKNVERRVLMKAIAAGSVTMAGLASGPSAGRRIGLSQVDGLVRRTAELRRLDEALGGRDTYSLFVAEMESTAEILKTASYNEATRTALLAGLSEQAQLAGWAAFDAGWPSRSARLYRTSRSAAHEAGNSALFANALALEAYQRAFNGAPDIGLARASCSTLDDCVPARVRALIHDRAAWSFAVCQQAAEVETALHAAARALEDAETAPPASPDWAAWVDRQELAIMTGRCWSELQRPLRAVPPLEQALQSFPDAYARDKALYLLALAEAFVCGHEIEQAAVAIRRAHRLAAGVASSRPHARLLHTLAVVDGFAAAAPIRDLYAEIQEVPGSPPGAPT